MDYTGLQTNIAGWLNRTDLQLVIPQFIALAELDINRKARASEMMAKVTEPVMFWATLPTDCLAVDSLALPDSNYTPVKVTSRAELDKQRGARRDPSKDPAWCAIVGRGIEFDVPFDSTTNVLVRYYRRLTSLSDANPSNPLLANHWDLFLYGALAHAAPYLGDDARVTVWAAGYQRALDGVSETAYELAYSPEMSVRSWSF